MPKQRTTPEPAPPRTEQISTRPSQELSIRPRRALMQDAGNNDRPGPPSVLQRHQLATYFGLAFAISWASKTAPRRRIAQTRCVRLARTAVDASPARQRHATRDLILSSSSRCASNWTSRSSKRGEELLQQNLPRSSC